MSSLVASLPMVEGKCAKQEFQSALHLKTAATERIWSSERDNPREMHNTAQADRLASISAL